MLHTIIIYFGISIEWISTCIQFCLIDKIVLNIFIFNIKRVSFPIVAQIHSSTVQIYWQMQCCSLSLCPSTAIKPSIQTVSVWTWVTMYVRCFCAEMWLIAKYDVRLYQSQKNEPVGWNVRKVVLFAHYDVLPGVGVSLLLQQALREEV